MKKRKPPAASTPKALKTRTTARKLPPPITADGDGVTGSLAFLRATAEAEACSRNPARLRELLSQAMNKLNYVPRGPFAETWPYLMAMIRLIRSYHQEEYRDISPEHFFLIIAAIIYFVSPNDAIPDSVPILGQLDDAVVVRLALKRVSADLDTFMAWETVKI